MQQIEAILQDQKEPELDIREIVGGGYDQFWISRKRYLVCKGGRGSKKSKTAALRFIYNMMKYPEANLLVIRQVAETHRDSTYADLVWAIHRLNVARFWKQIKNPTELVYKPTGQKILFRGLDDENKLASITVPKGYLCWRWWEEAFEVHKESVFDKIDMGLRGKLPEGLWKEHVLTFNPWSGKHWLKKRFFDKEDPNVRAMTTTFFDNEFLGEDDLQVFEKMRKENKRRFLVEGLAEWGVAEGLVFDNFRVETFNAIDLARAKDEYGRHKFEHTAGLDFGFTNHPTAILDIWGNAKTKEIYIVGEYYQRGMTNSMIAATLHQMGLAKTRIYADSAEPKSIYEIETDDKYPCPLIRGCKKSGVDNVRGGIQRLQDYKIIIHPRCINTIVEINGYAWAQDKAGEPLNKPVPENDHAMDALRYGTENLGKRRHSTLDD